MTQFSYNVYHPLTGVFAGQLELKDPSWVESVNGSGTFSGVIVVPADPILVDQIRAATGLGMHLFVKAGSIIPWGGYITDRKWDPDKNELTISAVEWRAYLYRILIAPTTDLVTPNVYTYTATEQLEIARQIVTNAITTGLGAGVPFIKTGVESSGVLRDLIVRGTSFRDAGTWIDSMANRDRGFEWDISTSITGSGVPQLNFNTYYPQRGAAIPGLEFYYRGNSGNILNYEDPTESNADTVRRQWAIGSGPDSDNLPFAVDSDPDLGDNDLLRFDKATTWQDVIDLATLASHARAEREFYSVPLTLFSFSTRLDTPDVYSYAKGDRCRLVVKDRWLDIDLDNVRIIERQISPQSGGGLVKLTLDLSDLVLPESDTAGVV